jgi:16S rRNA (uracil1498-N3)-methyltransferase
VKIRKTEQFPLPEFGLHIAVAPTKMNERFEWFLEKATEIGVREITPLLCDHSERKVINHERFEKIMVAAMKQSNQVFLPVLHPLKTFTSFLEEQHKGGLYIAHCYEHDKKTLHSVLPAQTNATILIGPEGDFSEKEVKTALEKNVIPVSLGHTRLRTETAALVATHTFILKHES